MLRGSRLLGGLLISLFIFLLCCTIGSVKIPIVETAKILIAQFHLNVGEVNPQYQNILVNIRIPRIMATFLIGIALSLSGMTMQSLLKNPLADGSTLGISAGASLGAALAIAFGFYLPNLYFGSTFIMAILFSFLSLLIILFFSYHLDQRMNNMTVILTGIMFSMLISSALNLLIVFSNDKLKSIIFWTMGSLSGARYPDVIALTLAVVIGGLMIGFNVQELNAFAIGENIAHNLGVNVFRKRIILFIASSIMIGVSVSVAGSIPFVGLIIPHISRLIVGPNHRKLVVAVILIGGNFLMLADLLARTMASPVEIPIGVITSLIGTITFLVIFARKKGRL